LHFALHDSKHGLNHEYHTVSFYKSVGLDDTVKETCYKSDVEAIDDHLKKRELQYKGMLIQYNLEQITEDSQCQ
jgi:hypothetical protein